jgi:pimeloyl-ACP methyl ester carboxylesterase
MEMNLSAATLESRPIVILGGFLSPAKFYFSMQKTLAALSGQQVSVVGTQPYDWLPSVTPRGWIILLKKLDRTVRTAARAALDGRVVLIGHSGGGVLARLYLSPEPFFGHRYCGLERVAHLITLGSPHFSQGGMQRGGLMARYVQRVAPDAAFAPQVRYTCVTGKFVRGNRSGTSQERFAARVYKEVCGDENAWGDAITPIQSALLPGAEQIVLEGVSHYSIFGEPWYGSPSIPSLWWREHFEA